MLTENEKKQLLELKAKGFTFTQAMSYIGGNRYGATSSVKEQLDAEQAQADRMTITQPEAPEPKEPGYIDRVIDKNSTRLAGRVDDWGAAADRYKAGETGAVEYGVQQAGTALAAGVLDPVNSLIEATPGAETALKGVGKGIDWMSKTAPIKYIGDLIGGTQFMQDAVQAYDTDPNFNQTVRSAINIPLAAATVDAGVTAGTNYVNKGLELGSAGVDKLKNVIQTTPPPPPPPGQAGAVPAGTAAVTTEAIGSEIPAASANIPGIRPPVMNKGIPVIDATTQGIKDIASRGPRIVERVGEKIDDAAARAERIKTAETPELKTAYEVNLDENLIETTKKASAATKADMARMLDTAESGARGERVTNIPGEAAASQYEFIDTARKGVGTKIDEAINNLPNATVDMRPAYQQVDALLAQNGIVSKNGVLDFTQSSLAPEARKAVQSAYDLLHEAGDIVPAKVVHSKDSLFSNFNRELYAAKIPPVYVNVGGESRNLFNVLRDVYRTPLDTLSGGEFSTLNREYAMYRNMVDAMDESIFKMANVKGANIDPAAQAGINLRRIDTEAMSQPGYLSVAEQMDAMARELGYTGSNPIELLYFANDIKPLYTGSKTVAAPGGFYGSIKGALMDTLGKVTDLGTPNTADQINALRGLLKESGGFNSGAIPPTTKVDLNKVKTVAANNGYNYEQIVSDVEKKIALATESKPLLDAQADKVSQAVPGTTVAKAPPKGLDRSIEKVVIEENGNVESLKDLARNTIVPTTPESLAQVRKLMDARDDLFRPAKVQSPEEFAGYQGLIYNIKLPNGLIGETQVVTEDMFFGKMLPETSQKVLGDKFNILKEASGLEPGRGHYLYEEMRSMTAAEIETAAGAEKMNNLVNESIAYYGKLRDVYAELKTSGKI